MNCYRFMHRASPVISNASGALVVFLLMTDPQCFVVGGEIRKWTDATGKHGIDAEYVELRAGKVQLRTPDGKTVRIPVNKLSVEDRRYIAKQLSAKDAPTRKGDEAIQDDRHSPDADERKLRQIATKFYEGLRSDDRKPLASLLSKKARLEFESGSSPLTTLPTPDEGKSAIRIGAVKISGERATVSVRLLIDTESYVTSLALTKGGDDWGAVSLEAKQPDGTTKKIEFETTQNNVEIGANDGVGDVEAGRGDETGSDYGAERDYGADRGRYAAVVEQEADLESASPDPYEVPDGTPAETLQFIDRILLTQPEEGADVQQHTDRVTQAILNASDSVLASDAETSSKEQAAQRQMLVLNRLAMSHPDDAAARLQKLGRIADRLELDDLKRDVATLQLQYEIVAAQSPAEAVKSLRKVGALLAGGPLGASQLQLAVVAGSLAERLPGSEGGPMLEKIGALLMASSNQQFASIGQQYQASGRRLGLVGQEMALNGVLLDGTPLDAADLEGKVVLVDFWATWCGPCREELPNIRENYEKYHEQGFEVVGISLDQNIEELQKFMDEDQLPWTIVAEYHPSADPAKRLSAYYGVSAIPTTILIGRDGKVVSLEARGGQLGELLEKHL